MSDVEGGPTGHDRTEHDRTEHDRTDQAGTDGTTPAEAERRSGGAAPGVFDLSGLLRRIRRAADLSQRELAQRCGLATSTIAQAETGRRSLSLAALVQAAALAGLRLALLDETGAEIRGMHGLPVRDAAGRRFPAHLDTRYGDQDWWHSDDRHQREQPWYTFDRVRYTRDFYRARTGTPDDHQLPRPGDSPSERREARRRAARQAREEEFRQRMSTILPSDRISAFTCHCPPECAELDDYSGPPVHAENCPCRCDVG